MKKIFWIILVLWIFLLSWCSQNTSSWTIDVFKDLPQWTDEIEEKSNIDTSEGEEDKWESSEVQSYIFGQEFNIKYRETIYITNTDTKITFSEMMGDSRCPSDVQCIWAWEANIILLFDYPDTTSETLEISFQWITEGMYSSMWDMMLELQELSPYPKSSEEILLTDYSLTWVAHESSYEPFKK